MPAELLRYLQGELRSLERLLDKPLPLASHAEKQAALRSVREMRDRVYAASGVEASDGKTQEPAP
jgi:hypothetical protein